MGSKTIFKAVIIILLITIPGFAHAASSGDIKFYASGDPIYITGKAPGAQPTGLAAWIFGQNYWSTESVDTDTDGSYTYEIEGGLTSSLAPGQYFVIIQHPMYNGLFDVISLAGAPSSGKTSVISTTGDRFILEGQGKLQGSSAAYALMNLLDSQDIDDTYTTTTFYIEEPWLKTHQTEGWPAGSVIRLGGTTNIAPGERLVYTFYQVSEDIPSSKLSEDAAYTTEMAGQTDVRFGMPHNLWDIEIDTRGMDPGTYIFTIEAINEGKGVQKYITLYEPAETYETEVEVAHAELVINSDRVASDGITTPTQTLQAPLSFCLAIISLLVAVLITTAFRYLGEGSGGNKKFKKR